MSHLGREELTEHVAEKVKPDSQKTTGEQISDNVTDGVDKVAAAIQSESDKSAAQKLGDHVSSGVDSPAKNGKTLLDSAQETGSDLTGAASEKIKAVVDYVTGTTAEDDKDATA